MPRLYQGTRIAGRLSPDARHLFGEEPKEIVRAFCGRLIKVRAKTKKTVPLIFNPIQERLHEERTGDDLVVKARQEGVTTYFVADALAKAILWENERRVIAFHREDAARAARRDILGFMFDHLPEEVRPIVSQDNLWTIHFPLWHSSIEVVYLAGEVGRSGMITGLHLSEAAFYRSSVAGIAESVAQGEGLDGEISVESTGDDPSGEFYEAAMAAWRGQSSQKLHFFSWRDNPEYQLTRGKPLGALTKKEKGLVVKGATTAQLRWRRWKKSQIGFLDDPTRFPREYPDDVHEAFQYAGDKFFPVDQVDAFEKWIEAEEPTPVLEDGTGWTYWEPIDPKNNYVLAADVSSGTGKAASSAFLINATDWTEAARFHSKTIPEDLFAEELARVGEEAGWALLAPEANNMGHAVVNHLLHVVDYPNLHEHEPYHSVTKPGAQLDPYRTVMWGWYTDTRTRPLIFSAVRRELRERTIRWRSLTLVDEIRKTIRDKGKPVPGLGSTGDQVMAAGIALVVLERSAGYSGGRISAGMAAGGRSIGGERLEGAKGATLTGILGEEF